MTNTPDHNANAAYIASRLKKFLARIPTEVENKTSGLAARAQFVLPDRVPPESGNVIASVSERGELELSTTDKHKQVLEVLGERLSDHGITTRSSKDGTDLAVPLADRPGLMAALGNIETDKELLGDKTIRQMDIAAQQMKQQRREGRA